MELQLQHLSKHYGTKRAVRDINVSLTPEIYGLLGANGAGKTTLIRMIRGVLKATSGHILLDGDPMGELGEQYYSQLGYMPQDFGFYPDFTAREFMLYMAAVKGLSKKKAKSRTEKLLALVNLQDTADKKIKSYSGGMKQRPGIAPVFSGEYQAGTDAVILSGKYGKTKLVTAKIIASFLFGFLAFTLHILVARGLPLAAFGADGWDLPVQIANTAIPYPFTFPRAALVSIGVIYLILLAMISLTLLLSANLKTPYLVLAVLVPVLFIPMFLTPSGTSGAYNLTLFLLPFASRGFRRHQAA